MNQTIQILWCYLLCLPVSVFCQNTDTNYLYTRLVLLWDYLNYFK